MASTISVSSADISAQESFHNRYEDDPLAAICSYTRQMHLHTQRQLELARRAARRRMTDSSNEQTNPIPMLMPESSVDSTQTQGSR